MLSNFVFLIAALRWVWLQNRYKYTCKTRFYSTHWSLQTIIKYFFYGSTATSGPRPPHCRSFTITLTHTTFRRTPLNSPSQRPLTIHNTRKRQTAIPLAGFEPAIPSKWAAADPRLKRRGHWDRLIKSYTGILLLMSLRSWAHGF
jgi:hypothetical protein